MKHGVLAAGVVSVIALVFIIPESTESNLGSSQSGARIYPIKGRILVSFRQDIGENDYFSTEDGEIRSRMGSYRLNQLKAYGLRHSGKESCLAIFV
jgi:hypothetical protein